MARRRYLVAYDIREPKRLRDVRTAMKAFGYPIQYSVFVCDLDGMEVIGMRRELSAMIDHGRDSVAVIDLGDTTSQGSRRFEFLGKAPSLPQEGAKIV